MIGTTEKNIYKDNTRLGEMKVYRTPKFGQNLENNKYTTNYILHIIIHAW